tara:strand:+ start:591 stop:995 length:405 start_codon:yes stop_codon:yes gene_type:complete
MLQRKIRRFRHRSKNRIYQRHSNNTHQRHSNGGNVGSGQFINGQRNIFRSTQSAEKLFEKYNALAKEAISAGDKTLSENYLQHADHFMRVIEDKNKNQTNTGNNLNENKIDSLKDTATNENKNLEQLKNNKNPE